METEKSEIRTQFEETVLEILSEILTEERVEELLENEKVLRGYLSLLAPPENRKPLGIVIVRSGNVPMSIVHKLQNIAAQRDAVEVVALEKSTLFEPSLHDIVERCERELAHMYTVQRTLSRAVCFGRGPRTLGRCRTSKVSCTRRPTWLRGKQPYRN